VDTPRPSPRTNRTRRVPHPVLIGRRSQQSAPTAHQLPRALVVQPRPVPAPQRRLSLPNRTRGSCAHPLEPLACRCRPPPAAAAVGAASSLCTCPAGRCRPPQHGLPSHELRAPGAVSGARRARTSARRGRQCGQDAAGRATVGAGRAGPRGDADTRARARAPGGGRRGGRLEGLALHGARVQLAALMLARRHHLCPQCAALLLPSAPADAHIPRTARAEPPRLPPHAGLAPRRGRRGRRGRACSACSLRSA